MATSYLIIAVIAPDSVLAIIKARKIKSHCIKSIITSGRILQKRFIYLIFITGYLHPYFVKIPQCQFCLTVPDCHIC